ncbi:ABC transporter permease [Aestuariirhabdus sp. Z084]|uniref:PhnE/PtxC family ABC transporter permease n=1 Tax=Aestuariirhabdus haliotis TaxID=2918751 RepID=UPI00201B44C9|nr:ABC transporter permease [Aestuariirhabdus haliotis]MCL6414022.1 ABC transporter permease [Aestuariirhabdus haliotis]MCL6417955.1 ABC transporter permease [Aestuariirhabdus haliotis]
MNSPIRYRRSGRWKVSWLFVCTALLCLPFADLSISTYDPWAELGRLFGGLLQPSLAAIEAPIAALLQTLAFALLGVSGGALVGFGLAQLFHWRWLRMLCASLRAVHELFWALIFLQIFGLHPLTGLLALGIPYAATFAKVYAEILEEGDRRAYEVMRQRAGPLSAFFYARLPALWQHFVSYTSYRLECGLRSSAVLGFVGLPTLGYYLSTAFMEGNYAEVWALLILFYVIIASLKFWARPRLLPVYLIAAPFIIANDATISLANVSRFFIQDIVPLPLRNGEGLEGLWRWFSELFVSDALPGIVNTLLLTQLALVLTGFIALLWFPLISKLFFQRAGRMFGHLFLVVMRSTPEYILAFILLALWGPSMLPAVIALALHNGAIIAHLMGRYSHALSLRPDSPTGINRYAYEVLPGIYNQFLAFLFYRWEIIQRETAILGILGITTLGFYIDSAIQDIRLDRAMVLIAITAALNVAVDAISHNIRSRLRLTFGVKLGGVSSGG